MSPRGQEDVVLSGQFVPPTLPQPNAATAALQRTFSEQCSQPFGPSPFIDRTPPKPAAPKEPVSVPVVAEPSTPQSHPVTPPSLTVTSIMAGQGQPCATIGGKVRRIGDPVGNGFVVVLIDGALGKVEIANGDVHVVLQLKNPMGE
jgi:hypothetical protein